MESNNEKKPDPSGASNAKIRTGRAGNGRARFYGILLLFTVIGGSSLAVIPRLRSRLKARVSALQGALFRADAPATADMGAEETPFPEEYKRTSAEFPNPGQELPEDWISRQFALKHNLPSPPAPVAEESVSLLQGGEDAESDPAPDGKAADDEASEAPGSETASWYLRGEREQEAYDLLLKAYPNVEAMVRSGDSPLKFIAWGGMRRSDIQYWIRLLFRTGDGIEEEYIWEVDLKTKKVAPLSHNARSIS